MKYLILVLLLSGCAVFESLPQYLVKEECFLLDKTPVPCEEIEVEDAN